VSLERTIRPFQLPAVTPPALVLDDTKQADPVAVSLGREGGKRFDYSYSFSSSVHSATDSYKEVSRKTETKRIENPDDSDQFVEIKRATEIKLVNENDPKLKRKYTFHYPDNTSS
jgi:hypothetical protein